MYAEEDHRSSWAAHTKHYQHIEFQRVAARFAGQMTARNVGEIGAKSYFDALLAYARSRRFVIDPYRDAPGGGLSSIPALPFPIGLFRCYVGFGDTVIPDEFFSLTFSISVVEHIGQQETGFDRHPVVVPPLEQEQPRDAFCRDLFRLTAPGGLTIHTVDHASRNRSYVENFLKAGFELIDADVIPSLSECMEDRTNVVQLTKWGKEINKPSGPEDWALDSVLMMGFKRPAS